MNVSASQPLLLEEIEREWRSLEQHADGSFFLTWEWVGSLLGLLEPGQRPYLLRVSEGSETIALACIGESRERRRKGLVRSRVLHLHETGNREFDRLTVEHNDLLVRRGWERQAIDAVLDHLLSRREWDELRLSGIDELRLSAWTEAAQTRGLKVLPSAIQPRYVIDLASMRTAGRSFIESVSSNTRYQIRRSTKLYAARGPVTLWRATSEAEAEAWFEQLAELHQTYWTGRGERGAFATKFARDFHRRLLRSAWGRERVELVRVDAGLERIGYLYNFRKDGAIHNYQSAFVYESDPKLKPGLVCHALAVDDALARGLQTYDLLAGGGHYKQSLAPLAGHMHWISLQRPRLAFMLEESMRGIRQAWLRKLAAPPTL